MQLREGDKAPGFSLPDQDGKTRSLNDYKDKWLILYFYPKDFTSGCTTEACSLRDNFAELSKLVEIVGVSMDSVESHKKFKQEHRLQFTLLSDGSGTAHEDYEARSFPLNRRITFLINPKGVIGKIYEKVDPQVHAKEILNDLKSLQ